MPDDAVLDPEGAGRKLERLRAEVAELRSQAAAAPPLAETPVAPPPHRGGRWRSVVAPCSS